MPQRSTVDPSLLGVLQALYCDRVTAEVVTAMTDRGVPSIVLKGPSIARWLYPSGGRTYVDTDLLVKASDFGHAKQVLMELGYTEKLADYHPFEIGQSLETETPFVRRSPDTGLPTGNVDLHHNLSPLRVPDDKLWQVFAANAESASVAGTAVTFLGRPALAFHVVAHAVQHDFTLHTGEDLKRVVAAVPAEDWRAVAEVASELGAEDILGTGLRHDPAGTAIADSLGLAVLARGDRRFWTVSAPPGSASLDEFSTAKSWRERMRWIRWTLVPSRARMRVIDGIPLGAPKRVLLRGYTRRWLSIVPSAISARRYLRAFRDRN